MLIAYTLKFTKIQFEVQVSITKFHRTDSIVNITSITSHKVADYQQSDR